MSIALSSQGLADLAPVRPQPPQAAVESGGFDRVLEDVNGILETADQLAVSYAQGKVGLTEAVLAASQADTAFQLVMGVRNRALTAYQEIMNLQV